MKKFFYRLLFLIAVLAGCNDQKIPGQTWTINNDEAKVTGKAQLNKLYSIDLEYIDEYQISNYIWIDVDDRNRLYVLDLSGQNLHRFNSNGTYDRILIGKGAQREKLSYAENFCTLADTLFIHDRFTGIKVFDLDGRYIQTYFLERPRNKGIFKPIGKYLFGNERISVKGNISQSTWYLTKFGRNLKPIKRITEVKTDFFRTPQFEPAYILCFDSEGNTYFPVSRDVYRITKFDFNGNKLFTFGRKYVPNSLPDTF